MAKFTYPPEFLGIKNFKDLRELLQDGKAQKFMDDLIKLRNEIVDSIDLRDRIGKIDTDEANAKADAADAAQRLDEAKQSAAALILGAQKQVVDIIRAAEDAKDESERQEAHLADEAAMLSQKKEEFDIDEAKRLKSLAKRDAELNGRAAGLQAELDKIAVVKKKYAPLFSD